MGNSRFRLSDMMPNAWFYKLKDMGKGKNQATRKKKQQSSSASVTKQLQQGNTRKSHYFTRELTPSDRIYTSPAANPEVSSENLFPEPPRKSSKQRPKRKTQRSSNSPKLVNSSVSAGCSCRTTADSVWTKSDSPPECSSSPFDDDSSPESEFPEPDFRRDRVLAVDPFDEIETVLSSNSCGCRLNSNAQDIVIDVDKSSIARKDDKLNGYDSFAELELPPIITKPVKFDDLLSDAKKREKPRSRIARNEEPNLQKPLKVKTVKEDTASIEEQKGTPVQIRRFSVSSPGVKLRIHSPRIGFGSRKSQGHGRKSVSSSSSSRRSLSDSFAVVKSSFNPQRDFRESMVEMIMENNIRGSKDLEDLLACYLSLNSDEYHDIIIKVFKQVWFDLTDTQKK